MAVRPSAPKAFPADAEERLLIQAAQEDPARFGDLYDLHFERVYGFVSRRVGNRQTAEDLTSDVFHKALANLRSYEIRGAPFAAWLIRIAANAIVDYSKRAAREVGRAIDPSEPGNDPDLDAIEDGARLFRLVDRLPDDQRNVIFGRFVDQRSTRDLAQQMGRSEGAVKQLQFRALQSLRKQMEGGHA